jgi:hypothetical protein
VDLHLDQNEVAVLSPIPQLRTLSGVVVVVGERSVGSSVALIRRSRASVSPGSTAWTLLPSAGTKRLTSAESDEPLVGNLCAQATQQRTRVRDAASEVRLQICQGVRG